MIIFNDSIPVQPPKVASAVCKCQGFCRGMSMLFSIVSARQKKKRKKKKNTDAFKSTEIFKKCTSKNKIYFCLKKKSNVSLNKKVIFGFHTIFKLVFITQINYINYIDVCILFLFLFVLLYLILRNGTYIQLAKVQQQNEWK